MSVRFPFCLILVAALAPACEPLAESQGVIDSTSSEVRTQPGELELHWTFTGGKRDVAVPPPPNGTTLELVFAPLGTPCPGPGCIIECFDATKNQGVANVVPPNTYDVYVNLTDLPANKKCGTGNPSLLARSGFQQVVFNRTDRAGKRVDFTFPVDGAFFRVDWAIAGAVRGTNLRERCRALLAGGTSVRSTLANANGAFEDIFNCDAPGANALTGSGKTAKLGLGKYAVKISLIDGGRPPAAISNSAVRKSELWFGNQLETLAPVVFEVQRNGNVFIKP
jgi:hypothetical protein